MGICISVNGLAPAVTKMGGVAVISLVGDIFLLTERGYGWAKKGNYCNVNT